MEDMGNYGYTLFRTIPSLNKLLPNKSVRRRVRRILFLALLSSPYPHPTPHQRHEHTKTNIGRTAVRPINKLSLSKG